MAKDLSDIVGNVTPDENLNMKPDEQFLLIEGKAVRRRQVRFYRDRELFGSRASAAEERVRAPALSEDQGQPGNETVRPRQSKSNMRRNKVNQFSAAFRLSV
jgi:hypothetical protein